MRVLPRGIRAKQTPSQREVHSSANGVLSPHSCLTMSSDIGDSTSNDALFQGDSIVDQHRSLSIGLFCAPRSLFRGSSAPYDHLCVSTCGGNLRVPSSKWSIVMIGQHQIASMAQIKNSSGKRDRIAVELREEINGLNRTP